ncbi:amino acid adenylation domain-containing protein [Paenibacillus tarimensis]|uniref:amino acid adenylation domain-containing protein n=1 Tax=Paenibacillus tarimensis TaxID=416012 RepID=UPI001F304A39|nr:amino acid adenylation domain-containing protein [Paenibacillus tarimensis]MCF2945197.1 amino acid adenylation domain-containing protein [Paenibacillus tarimensis]
MTITNHTIYGQFREQAAVSPGRTAIISRGEHTSYGQLHEQICEIAAKLRAGGVGSGSVVGLLLGRTPALLAAILAVNKCGAAYMPIDPAYPDGRIQYMAEDSGAGVFIADHAHISRISQFAASVIPMVQCRTCTADGARMLGEHEEHEEYEEHGKYEERRDSPAYIMYTSGTTGRPKGVIVNEAGVLNLFEDMREKIGFHSSRTILCLSTVSFDIFAVEAILPLTSGMQVILADEGETGRPRDIARLIHAHDVDMLQLTPSRLQMLLYDPRSAVCLKKIGDLMIGGEMLAAGLINQVRRLTNARLYNMYGPTEATIWCSYREILNDQGPITIGTPVRGMRLLAVDDNLCPVQEGHEGELCIAGIGLAEGYMNQKELTDSKFVQNPYVPGERIYRTGDLAVLEANDEYRCLGRRDEQLKWRGHRMEPAEVEAALLSYPDVQQAVVWGDSSRNILVACLVTKKELAEPQLRAYLGKILPDYMIPGVYRRVSEIPLTPSGKTDRQALMREL